MKIKITCRPRYNPWLKKYLNTKTFSKMLALGILINNIPINSFAGILSDDGRYETFEGSDITVNDVLEEDKVDIEVEGNSLVNLHGKQKYGFAVQSGDAGKYIKTEEINYVSATIMEDLSSWYFLSFGKLNLDLIKPNTTYTIYFEKSKGVDFVRFCCKDSNGNIASVYKVPVVNNKAVIATTNFSLESINDDVLLYGLCGGSAGTEIEVSNAMIFEGNLEYESLDYFEGMKSVGQDDTNGHKIEISSRNKNLIDLYSITPSTRNLTYIFDSLTKTYHTSYSGNYCRLIFNISNHISLLEGHKIRATATYSNNSIADARHTTYMVGIDDNGNQTAITTHNGLDIPKGKYKKLYVYFFVNNTDTDLTGTCDVSNLQLEIVENNTDFGTEYVSSQFNKKEIPLSEPLRSLSNGVKDRIIKRNGQWVIERNLGEIIFDGSDDERWIVGNNSGGFNTIKFTIYQGIPGIVGEFNSLCDKFYYLDYNWGESIENDKESFSVAGAEGYDPDINIRILKSKLSTVDVYGFKQWLKDNPVKVIYKLINPIYEPLNINSTINTYLDTTHISTNSTIPANLKVIVDRVANRAKEFSELAKETPTIENISLARMWTNLMRESILKDEFQDNIDNITEIAEMTLDRKTASANIDVYIKSENMLSMNLSTNSITFDDFSGIEDMTKENAVNISINSSLPYNLNAYLATEIQNSDKSNAMNKDILSIKENSELDYQTFTNTIDKVVLKSNCNSGNDKQHDINLKLNGGIAHEKDVYKTTIKFEAEQQ